MSLEIVYYPDLIIHSNALLLTYLFIPLNNNLVSIIGNSLTIWKAASEDDSCMRIMTNTQFVIKIASIIRYKSLYTIITYLPVQRDCALLYSLGILVKFVRRLGRSKPLSWMSWGEHPFCLFGWYYLKMQALYNKMWGRGMMRHKNQFWQGRILMVIYWWLQWDDGGLHWYTDIWG